MAKKVTQVEKELMWTLYQKYGTFKVVEEINGLSAGKESR